MPLYRWIALSLFSLDDFFPQSSAITLYTMISMGERTGDDERTWAKIMNTAKHFETETWNEQSIFKQKLIEVEQLCLFELLKTIKVHRSNALAASDDPLLLSIKLFAHLIFSASFTSGQYKRLKSNIIPKTSFDFSSFASLFLYEDKTRLNCWFFSQCEIHFFYFQNAFFYQFMT